MDKCDLTAEGSAWKLIHGFGVHNGTMKLRMPLGKGSSVRGTGAGAFDCRLLAECFRRSAIEWREECVMPELRRSGAHWVVSVPSGAEIEALSLWRESGARGFFFNGFDDASNQAALNRILKLGDPTRVVVANFPGLEYQAIYDCESVRELILGYGCPWPDLARLKRLTCFSAMEIEGDLRWLPAGLLELGLYGFRAATLEPLSFLHRLQRLDLRMAGRLESLSGIGSCLSDLSLAGCPRLGDITALSGHASIERLSLSGAKGLVAVDEVFTLPSLRELILDKIKARPNVERLESMGLDHCYVNGRKLDGKSKTSGRV